MRVIRIAVLLTMVGAAAANAQSAAEATRAAATITPADIKAHIAYIASDEMKGRDTPSPGLEATAKYIADHFKSWGLKPAGDSGTYIQRWPYQTKKLDNAKARVTLLGAKPRELKLASEYFVLPALGSDSTSGEVLVAGDAASAQMSASYKDKVVTFTVPGGKLDQEWAKPLQGAAMAAIGSGARAMVLILDKEFGSDDIADAVANIQGVLTPIPIVGIKNDIAEAWASNGAQIVVRTAISNVNGSPPNVVGILEGSDPVLKDTYVVFSAHMDHIGVSSPNEKGDSINNGADDDASGTTGVLEIAQAFAGAKERPKRSIIFLLVSGEEKGLFGSKYFTEHPPVAANKIVADINIDMIGRNNPDTTVAIGQEYTTLGEITQRVTRAHPELHLTVAPDLWPEEQLFFRSDHFNFAVKQIPAIFFTSGLHADYHKPSDEPETIDNDKLARTAKLVFWLGHEIANSDSVPTWTEEGKKAVTAAASQQ